MIKTVASVNLPVDEQLKIIKNRLEPDGSDAPEKRICIVTGTHGDELEGQYVCYELVKRINQNKQYLKGIVDIYPALNPLGVDSITRAFPLFDLDMNRVFPGSTNGAMAEYVAGMIIEDIKGSTMCVDVHSSNIYLREIPQVRINETSAESLLPYAKLLNIDFVWVHTSATVLQSTLAHSLNTIGVPTLVVEMGVGMRITRAYGEQLVVGLFNLMKHLGIWSGPVEEVTSPIISTDGEVGFVSAQCSGIFIPCVEHWKGIQKGQPMGDILHPLTGTIEQRVIAPCDGMIFTLREYPVVYAGSLLARVLGGAS